MASYIHDGSFEGFLTCVYLDYYAERATDIHDQKGYPGSLFEKPVGVTTNVQQAEKVYAAIEKKISTQDLRRIYRAFSSSLPNKDMELLEYIRLGFSMGGKISLYHSNPVVKKIETAQHRVSREIERMLGLIRFSKLEGGVLYACIQPDHNILEFIADHFTDRLHNESFIIHDSSRDLAVLSQGGQWFLTNFSMEELERLPRFDEEEENIRLLWKKYFQSIAIKERTNPRCQRNFMPQRYWKNLTEMR